MLDRDGGVSTVGFFNGAADFDPGPGTFNLTVNGDRGSFISKLDSSGSFVSAAQMGNISALGMTMDAGGNLYLAGGFSVTADFDPGPGTLNLSPAGPEDAFIAKIGKPCPHFLDASLYGMLVMRPLCAREAYVLSNDIYASAQVTLARGPKDRFFLSSSGGMQSGQAIVGLFAPLVVEDQLHINGIDTGLGPYSNQPGVPPDLLYTPIETDLVPLPALELGTNLIPPGLTTDTIDLVDIDRVLYGSTALYLTRDCGVWSAGNGPTSLNWITHDDAVAGIRPEFDVRYGLLSRLEQDRDFSRASCLGHYYDTPGTDANPNPPEGDGYYYMARGLDSCVTQGYGASSLVPDPRDALNALPACP
jgi:hypothetical protein